MKFPLIYDREEHVKMSAVEKRSLLCILPRTHKNTWSGLMKYLDVVYPGVENGREEEGRYEGRMEGKK